MLLVGVAFPRPVAGEEACGPTVSDPIENPGGVPPGLGEASGLVASLRYPGVAWAHQDSGHDASIFALRFDDGGRATWMRKIPVPGARNADWEDVSYDIGPDGIGRLFVVESGGFGSRMIYEIREPHPDTGASAELLGQYSYALPDGGENIEASFMFPETTQDGAYPGQHLGGGEGLHQVIVRWESVDFPLGTDFVAA